MENAIKALETAAAAILLALSLAVFMRLDSASKECEEYIYDDISKEWLIIEGGEISE